MGGLVASSAPKPVPPPPPVAIPEVGPEAGDDAKRAAQRRSGFARTKLTGALEPPQKGRTTLG